MACSTGMLLSVWPTLDRAPSVSETRPGGPIHSGSRRVACGQCTQSTGTIISRCLDGGDSVKHQVEPWGNERRGGSHGSPQPSAAAGSGMPYAAPRSEASQACTNEESEETYASGTVGRYTERSTPRPEQYPLIVRVARCKDICVASSPCTFDHVQ